MASNYSVYIPRVFSNITEDNIRNIFSKLDIGEVSRVDFIAKENSKGEKYNMVFVWFSHWNDENSAAMNLKERIEDPNTQAKFVYDDPWYWILLPNTSKGETSNVGEQANTTQVEQQPVQQQPVQQQPVQQQPVQQQPVQQQPVYDQHQMMMHHQYMMQHQQMMYMQPGYYHQWNTHVPPLVEAPHGHGVMNAYYGPDHGFENPNAVEVSPQDAAMMDEIEKMMDAE